MSAIVNVGTSGGGGGGSMDIQEDGVTVVAAATALNFVEPDLTLITASGTTANVAMASYLPYVGRPGAITAKLSTNNDGTLQGSGNAGSVLHLFGDGAGNGAHLSTNGLGRERLLVGVNFDPTTVFLAGGLLSMATVAEGSAGAPFGAVFAGDSPGDGAEFFGFRFRGTLASPTATQIDDLVLMMNAIGHDGTSPAFGAVFSIHQDAPPQVGNFAARFEFGTVDTNGTADTRMVIKNGGRIGFSTSFPGPDTMLHLGLSSNPDNRTAVTFEEDTTTPADPNDGSQMRVYMKADKFIIQYNDGGTVRYKYLDLTGTTVTWIETTVAP